MEPRRILGIDPGINGGCALYLPDSTVPTMIGGLFDIPTVGEGNQREIDYARLRDLIFAVSPTAVVIEIVNAFMPSRQRKKKPLQPGEEPEGDWGNTSLFRFGGSYFSIHAVVACVGIARHRVSSPTWKHHFGLRGKAKGSGTDDSARQIVLQRFPAVQPFLTRKKDQHRAEAFLMAVWYAETFGGSLPKRKPPSGEARKVRRAAKFSVMERDDDLDIPE